MRRRDLMVAAGAVALPMANLAAQPATLDRPYVPGETPLSGPGHDLLRLINAAFRLPQKTEFETPEAYTERVRPLLERPVQGSVSLASLLAFRGPLPRHDTGSMHVGWTYDPGQQHMELSCLCAAPVADAGVNFDEFHHRRSTKDVGSYTGKTAFGRSVKVRQEEVFEWLLLGGLPSDFWYSAEVRQQLSSADAAQHLPGSALWVIGAAHAPFLWTDRQRYKPTIDSPYEQRIDRVGLMIKVSELIVVSKSGLPIMRREIA